MGVENSNQSYKDCVFSVSGLKPKQGLANGGRNSRPEKQNQKSDFNEKVDISFSVYPNPMVDITYLLVNSTLNRTVNVTVINNQGQVVKKFDVLMTEESEFVKIDMNEFGPGVYFFKVSGTNNEVTTTAVKTNK